MISQNNGHVHAKKMLPQHRIQSRFRPVLRQNKGVQLRKINTAYFNESSKMPFKRRNFEILPEYAIISS